MNDPRQQPPVGADVSSLMTQAPIPAIGEDVSHLMAEPTFKTEVRASDGVEPEGGGIGGFARELWERINPVALAKGIYGAAQDIPGTIKGMGEAQEAIFRKAQEAAAKGDYVTAARHGLNYLIPVLGPDMDHAADMLREGRTAESLGATAGIGAQLVAPAGIAKAARSVRAPALSPNPIPAEADAVAFGLREGVPVDAGTATGNRFIKGLQRVTDESFGGSFVSGKANQQQAVAMQRVGERLADDVHPATVTAEQAGLGVREGVEGVITRLGAEADAAYSKLRAFEEQATPTTVTGTVEGRVAGGGTIPVPQTSQIKLAVDITGTKKALQPTYEALKQENALVPFMSGSGKGRALVALEKLMAAPDYAPLSIADSALGELKAMARGAELPALRNEGQGIAAHAVSRLDAAVRETAAKAGPDVLKALLDGRSATVQKYAAADILKHLSDEPVRTAGRLTASKDSSVSLLRRVKKIAPAELPKVGRAVLEGLLEKATAEGGFGRGAGIYADWQRLGPETKMLLYGPQASQLDSFFLLAKKLDESPNPSGTALTLSKTGEVGLIVSNPLLGSFVSLSAPMLSKLARNPKFITLLTRGMKIPVGNKAAATALFGELTKIARESGVNLSMAPALSDQEAQRKR